MKISIADNGRDFSDVAKGPFFPDGWAEFACDEILAVK